ncbi:MAG: hypothetical protein ABIP61_01515 [Burkholderiaceae bacterium]
MSRPRRPGRIAALAALALLVLLAPPVRHALESSMTAQMLLQVPLLIGVGVLLARALPPAVVARLAPWNQLGITGLVLASVASALWMLPRALDASVTEPLVATAKYLSLPLLVGLPFALSWPRMNFIVRGVFLLELMATFFRLGWLYLISPERLCNLYLLDDQQRLGQYMLVIGAVLFLGVACKLLWGRFDIPAEAASPPPAH